MININECIEKKLKIKHKEWADDMYFVPYYIDSKNKVNGLVENNNNWSERLDIIESNFELYQEPKEWYEYIYKHKNEDNPSVTDYLHKNDEDFITNNNMDNIEWFKKGRKVI